jgi:hypothetical protein
MAASKSVPRLDEGSTVDREGEVDKQLPPTRPPIPASRRCLTRRTRIALIGPSAQRGTDKIGRPGRSCMAAGLGSYEKQLEGRYSFGSDRTQGPTGPARERVGDGLTSCVV